ncbi:hypothetical protein AYJ57_21275 (plasmid) [Salipiger sp. CCB-MM3]|nr:hypothetical protein AYJ57_21275 [Salipiger sp. CCB-MM3]
MMGRRKEKQYERLHRVSQEARDIRLSFRRGDITEDEALTKLQRLRRPDNWWERLFDMQLPH